MCKRTDLAMVVADLGAGGAQRVVLRAAEALIARGYRVAVVTLAGPQSDFYTLPPGVARLSGGGVGVSRNRLIGLWRNVERILALRRALRETGAATVLSFVTQTNVLTILASFGLRTRVVVSERNDPQRQHLSRLWKLLRAQLYRHADAVTINSQHALAALEAAAPQSHPVFLPNPPPPARTPIDPTKPATRLLNVGRLHKQKAQDILLDAFAILLRSHPDVRLSIAGEGEALAALEARAKALGVAGRVEFMGTVVDIDAIYRAASIFVLPSRHEGTPNSLLEAMSYGLPCVVSDASPGLRETIENEREGLVVPVDDAPALAHSLARLVDSPALRARLGAAAHAKIRSYASSSVLEAWEAVLQLSGGRINSAAI